MESIFINAPFMSVGLATLVTQWIVIAFEALGLTQCYKKYCPKRGCKTTLTVSILLCVICAFANSHLVKPEITTFFNILVGSVAVMKLCHDVLVTSLPEALGRYMTQGKKKDIVNE